MQYGTSHFVSKQAAIRYYRPQYDNTGRAVEHKIADGEIHIGPPELKAGESCYVNAEEGRYFVTVAAFERCNVCLFTNQAKSRELALQTADRVIAALETCKPPFTGLSRSLIADAIEEAA